MAKVFAKVKEQSFSRYPPPFLASNITVLRLARVYNLSGQHWGSLLSASSPNIGIVWNI